MFISLDGPDGCGKSTQSKRLADRLEGMKYATVRARDPGTTRLGDALRDVLLNRKDLKITPLSELFIFMSARTQMLEEVVRPALAEKKIVVCDRFLLSSIAYQGYAGGLSIPLIEQIGKVATMGTVPNITYVLDIPYEVARKRMGARSAPDRMESKGQEFHNLVRTGFLKHAQSNPSLYVLIDASQSPEAVEYDIWTDLEKRLQR